MLELPEALAYLPWELLCDPGLYVEEGFLAFRRPLMRFHPSDTPTPKFVPPLRVLLLISSLPELGKDARVDIESERAAIEEAVYEMRQAGHFTC